MLRRDIEQAMVGSEFRELLSQVDEFKGRPNAIACAWRWLCDIETKQRRMWGDEWPACRSEEIRKVFIKAGSRYASFVEALGRTDLIQWTPYQIGIEGIGKPGYCRRFRLTDKCRVMVARGRREWLAATETDARLGDYARKGRDKARLRGEPLASPFARMVNELCCTVEFDPLPDGVAIDGAYCTAIGIMGELSDGRFQPPSSSTGRTHHPLVRFPRRFRRLIRLGSKRYLATVDIRACWPTFYARCLRDFGRWRLGKGENSLGSCSTSSWDEEVRRWDELFTAEADPREVIAASLGLKTAGSTKGRIKEAMNRWINGGRETVDPLTGRKDRRLPALLDGWLAKNYPALSLAHSLVHAKYRGWVARQLAETYEEPVMTDMRLYDIGRSAGLVLIPEHDGVGVLANPSDEPFLPEMLTVVADAIAETAARAHGLRVVAKAEMVSAA